MKITLSPIIAKRDRKWEAPVTYVENVVFITDAFPWAVCHIDIFHNPSNQDIYNRLRDGIVVNVELSIATDEVSEQDRNNAEQLARAIMAGLPG